MTIKVEQETLLRVLERQPTHSALEPQIDGHEEYIFVDFPKPLRRDDFLVEKIPHSTCDDDDSVFTQSTASLSDTDSEMERRVSFSDDLITEQWTRPFTPKEEVSDLYYTTEETQR